MYTLKFANQTLQLILNDSDHTDAIVLNQPFRPGSETEDKKAWDSSGEALSYWNDTLSNNYPLTENNITIEV